MSAILNRAQWVQIGALSTGCLVAYAGIRSLPVEPCEFLHYGDFVNEEVVIRLDELMCID